MFFFLHDIFLLCRLTVIFLFFFVTDITIENLQKVATTHVDASFKARCFGGGIHMPMSKPLTNLLLFFLFAKKCLPKTLTLVCVQVQVGDLD